MAKNSIEKLDERISSLGRHVEEARQAPAPTPNASKRLLKRYQLDREEIEVLPDAVDELKLHARLLKELTSELAPELREQFFFHTNIILEQCMVVANGLSISRQKYGAELDKALNTATGIENGAKAPQVAGKDERDKNMREWIKANWKKYQTYKELFAENADYVKSEFNKGERKFMEAVSDMRKKGELPKRKKEKSSPKARNR